MKTVFDNAGEIIDDFLTCFKAIFFLRIKYYIRQFAGDGIGQFLMSDEVVILEFLFGDELLRPFERRICKQIAYDLGAPFEFIVTWKILEIDLFLI